ncbi:hypothetical protein PoB_002139800 [Plakobranchus ocellatus]|uniref:Uncharacterized protein n=1 Tax=Plakobranchus ocellatus TaxID=259542 RepID=A0AAV3ZJA6_9GAST|nr:hypothetical protein PoB_002139800 [Plakobranchus ocellatus]
MTILFDLTGTRTSEISCGRPQRYQTNHHSSKGRQSEEKASDPTLTSAEILLSWVLIQAHLQELAHRGSESLRSHLSGGANSMISWSMC